MLDLLKDTQNWGGGGGGGLAKLFQAVVGRNDQANFQSTLNKGQGVQVSLFLRLIVD